MFMFFYTTFTLLTTLAVIIIFTPIYVIPGMIIGGIGMWIGQRFLRVQLPAKREQAKAKAPVLAVIGSALSGLGKQPLNDIRP
jgi:hypothetical protein